MRTHQALLSLLVVGVAAGCSSGAGEGPAAAGTQALSTPITGVTFKTNLLANFIGAENDGGSTVVATATIAQGWETFTLLDQNGGSLESGDEVFIETGDGDFFQAANGGGTTLNAASHNQEGWETFRVVKVTGTGVVASGDSIGL